ncbi:ankyrin repeat domain protein [Nitzschia inconspicua]|uniref:Ankyrin repeat domain protein n=1 Tax=Nitzschia inconspicua TaxID=303405 RepID=A0A9K3L6A1_9STRA|nr:ankyrin repeat domain protein [Nitzschia inconspicua]
MSKRSDLDGSDGSNTMTQGLITNPLAYESSAERHERKDDEMGPLQEQDATTTTTSDDDGTPGDRGITATTAIITNESNGDGNDGDDDDDPPSSSLEGISSTDDTPSQHSEQQQQQASSDQAFSSQQRKRQLPLQHRAISTESSSGIDDENSLEHESEMISIQTGGIDQPFTMTESSSGSHNEAMENETPTGSVRSAIPLDDLANTDQEVPITDGSETSHNVTWMPQNEQSICEFSHTITEYSQKRDSGCKKAEYSDVTIDDRGNKWRLIVYVNGNGRASNHHLSLFLQVADADDLPFGWKKAVSYVLTLEHPEGGGLSYAKRNPDKTFKMCPKAIDWGWSQFITSDKIQQEGFIQNDSLVVRASVTVKSSSVTIDADDAELYLKCAVEEGKPDAVQLCLDQGASVNCQFKDDLYTPLHTACSVSPLDQENGDDDSTKLALASPAFVEGSMKVLELLLKEGADGNACNKWKETPLLIAANNGHKNAVEALLKFGADPSLCSEAGWSALTFAAHKGYDEIVALLLSADAPINCRVAEDASTPLHKACAGGKAGHLQSVKLLLEGGADVHALNKWRETPLLTAANHGQAGAVEALLRAGADPCKCTDTGWSPLSIAAYKGHNDVVKLLLDEGAPTEEADPTLSALLQAATKGLPDTVELLLEHGADHTVTTKKGDTALSILVEQNLIDAAVDMVARYKASIPRCSRDRKKVQKARLLINLRSKQIQQKGGRDPTHDVYNDNGESSDDGILAQEETAEQQDPLQDPIKNTQGTNRNGRTSAEEQAKAAEEALLMELEMEDAERSKQEKEANKKLAKKRKKKERERQLKKEQEEKKLAEERAAAEKRKKEAEAREKAEKAERDRLLAARKKQEQEFLRKQAEDARKQQREEEQRRKTKKEDEAKVRSHQKSNAVSPTSINGRKSKQETKNEERTRTAPPKGQQLQPQKATSPGPVSERSRPAPTRKKRGWESLPGATTTSKPSPSRDAVVTLSGPTYLATHAVAPGKSTVSLETDSSGASIGETSAFSEGQRDSTSPNVKIGKISTQDTAQTDLSESLEPPAVSIFRREKIFELLHRCSLAHLSNDVFGCVNETILRTVLLRWVARASHEDSQCFDFIIPSWKDSVKLITFFQRQFITESRKGASGRPMPSMESLKEAGAAMASYCQLLAKNVLEYRQQVEHRLPIDWDDNSVGMAYSEVVQTMGSPTVIIDWSKQSQIHMPTSVFLSLKKRYRGPPSRFFASTFVCKVFHDTISMLSSESPSHWELLPFTQERLSRHLSIDAEVWSDPFSVYGNNRFWGRLPNINRFFGGLEPFTSSEDNNQFLGFRGGSVLLFVPPDNMIASQYIRYAVGVLINTSSVPLSFAMFLRPDCLVDGSPSFTANHLYTLDPRLAENRDLICCIENLGPGQHAFFNEKLGAPTVSPTGSLFVVLQNSLGRNRYPLSDMGMAEILDSMKSERERPYESSGRTPISFSASAETYNPNGSMWAPQSDFSTTAAAAMMPTSPLSHQPVSHGSPLGSRFQPMPGNISGTFQIHNSPTGQRRSVPRRGRLFDLVDDGGEEDNMNDVVSGMLGTFNVDLFQNTGVQDVDIEAISLMGIGGSTQPGSNTLQPRGTSSQGRFG